MKLEVIVKQLEALAPPALQESYDNAQLLTGNFEMEVSGVLTTLDCTEEVVDEAIRRDCNMIVAHHPILFSGLKSLTGKTYIERTLIKAIKNDVAIYAIHTNLDNVWQGVNRRIGERLGVTNIEVLTPKSGKLLKLITFIPHTHLETVRSALFAAGAGHIGEYDQCSFSQEGSGSFRGSENSKPTVGKAEKLHHEPESKLEVILPTYLKSPVVKALTSSHPYEEAAYDLLSLQNEHPRIGSGMIGELPEAMGEEDFLKHLSKTMKVTVVRHTALLQKPVKRIAWCGGAGSFLLKNAIGRKADVFITGDFKYHEFFDAEERLVIMDIGHFESEQFTPHLLAEYLLEKFHTFAVLLSEVKTNPVHYFSS